MSKPNVSVFMLQRLHAWGVRRIYGYPGDGTNGLNLAFHEVGDEVEFVQVRHEELAAFAACAHAKLTGEVGVCMATSGPGAIHLLNGLYDAKLDNAPVVAIVGQEMPYEEPPRAHGALFAGEPGFHDPVIRPGDDDLRRAAEVLNAGSKVAIL